MSCYISSNNNRVYVEREASFGTVPAITESNRIPVIQLEARQKADIAERRDKTGSRTFVGLPNHLRRETSFRLKTVMTAWSGQGEPGHGRLFGPAMGGTPVTWSGGTVASVAAQTEVTFNAAHGLTVGQGVAFNGEMRFVTAVANSTTVVLNAPFTLPPVNGSEMSATVSYQLGTQVGSVSIFDSWDPGGAVQRIVQGAAVDQARVKVNGDYHEFEFAGPARDLIDSASFTAGQGGLTEFPEEPAQVAFDYTVVPGHLGQVWLGAVPSQFLTLTGAELTLDNNVELRAREFGSDFAKCIAAGQRDVRLNFSVLEQATAQTKELYQAARQRSPIGVMLQLGEQTGQLFGAYLPAVIPEVPEYDDGETRLEWKFANNRAQGTVNDELYIAFA